MKLAIFTTYERAEDFGREALCTALMAGLRERAISFSLLRPEEAMPDPRDFDAALVWLYLYGTYGEEVCFRCSRAVETAFAAHGIPVIQPLQERFKRHSSLLALWQANGVDCAAQQRFQHLDEIRLPYPLVLRVDGYHKTGHAFLAQNPAQAAAIVARRQREGARPLDLALEYIDIRSPDGYYRKWRSLVIGGEVIPWHILLADGWLVKLEPSLVLPEVAAEHHRFKTAGEPQTAEVRRAAAILGADIVALDYSRRADGRCVFWEGNAYFRMFAFGDGEKATKYRAAIQQSEDELRVAHRRLGLAIADMIHRRTAAARETRERL